jgi:SWI/SNF-related matrix-associated actin-dependent regulator of chromatin subfamily A3
MASSSQLTPGYSELDERDNSIELDYLGSIKTRVVGVQYYTGHVNRNEMVIFVREPDNPYDRFAIRVDNIHNEKVGHIPRTVVQHLSPLVDSLSILCEGFVPYGQSNKFEIPVVMDIYGDIADRETLARACIYAGCPLSFNSTALLTPPPGGASTSSAARSPAQAISRAPGAPRAQRLTSKQVAERVNTIFDSLMTEDGPREQIEPSEIITTSLYPHQKEALAWMITQENSNTLPVFWESQGASSYFHTLTNFTSSTRPKPTRGGILADDMGLGNMRGLFLYIKAVNNSCMFLDFLCH